LTCSGIDTLPLFPGASMISSSSRFVVEGMFQESGVVHSFKVVEDQIMRFFFKFSNSGNSSDGFEECYIILFTHNLYCLYIYIYMN